MLKNLVILAFALLLIPFAAHTQTNKAKQTPESDHPSRLVTLASPQQAYGPSLQPEHKERVDADVRVLSTPAKDGYDKAGMGINAVLVCVGVGGIVVAIYTLKKIERQTKATEDSAKTSAAQVAISAKALVLQFRPDVRIRAVRLEETDDTLSMAIVVVNRGGTDAHVCDGVVSLDWIYSRSTKSQVATARFEHATLRPGTQQHLPILLNDSWLMYRFSLDPQYSSDMRLRCEGTIVYRDDNGIERRTGFSRLRSASTGKWDVDPDPEYEYAD